MEFYDKTITIVNKLKKVDSMSATDIFIKSVVTNCAYKKVASQSVSGNVVNFGESITVLIPFGKGYLPYSEWKKDTSKGFTMSQGDCIFLDLSVSEIITPNNITSIKALYEPNVCDVRIIHVANDNGLAKVQLKIEGV